MIRKEKSNYLFLFFYQWPYVSVYLQNNVTKIKYLFHHSVSVDRTILQGAKVFDWFPFSFLVLSWHFGLGPIRKNDLTDFYKLKSNNNVKQASISMIESIFFLPVTRKYWFISHLNYSQIENVHSEFILITKQ